MTHDEIFETVKRNTMEILYQLPSDAVTMDSSLDELGADSVERADIITQSMQELNLKVPAATFAGVRNLGSLVTLLEEKLRAKAASPTG